MVQLSVWAQDLIDHLSSHMDSEREALRAYGDVIEQTSDARVALLVRHILEDEIRHHQQFADLRDRLRDEAEGRAVLVRRDGAAPDPTTSRALLTQTEDLLALEREDRKELKSLAKRLRQVEDTAWQSVLVEAMELDTQKHIKLLEVVRDLLRESTS